MTRIPFQTNSSIRLTLMIHPDRECSLLSLVVPVISAKERKTITGAVPAWRRKGPFGPSKRYRGANLRYSVPSCVTVQCFPSASANSHWYVANTHIRSDLW